MVGTVACDLEKDLEREKRVVANGADLLTMQGSATIPRWKVFMGLLLAGLCMALASHGAANFDRLLVTLTERWGAGPGPKFTGWRTLIANLANSQDNDRLKRTNDFFNRQMQFGEDAVVWGQPDYWATPMESIGKGSGDCEDFAIAKYYTLKEMGVASEKLRLIYVRLKTGSADAAPSQAHMVLAYYAQPEAEPLIMDNVVGDIRSASRRPDLVPVYSFNSEGVFNGTSGREANPAAGVGRMSRWEDLLKRARTEGFE
jgi:predicted transglutaminase-like cysteine proteinase